MGLVTLLMIADEKSRGQLSADFFGVLGAYIASRSTPGCSKRRRSFSKRSTGTYKARQNTTSAGKYIELHIMWSMNSTDRNEC